MIFFRKIINLTKTLFSRRIFNNLLSLFTLQGLSTVVSVVLFPYLTRTLGEANYGIVASASSFMFYFYTITEFGFNYIGVREISRADNDPKAISEIFSAINLVKICLMGVCFLAMNIITWSNPRMAKNYLVYLFAFEVVIRSVFNPVWYYQGIQRMKFITILFAIGKSILIFLVFLVVKRQEDFIIYSFLLFLESMTVCFFSQLLILKRFKMRYTFNVPRKRITILLKEGAPIFLSQLALAIYTETQSFLLYLFTDETVTGNFSAAYNIINGIRILTIMVISQAVFPRISQLVKHDPAKGIKLLVQVFLVYCLIGVGIIIGISLFSDLIVDILIGSGYPSASRVLILLSTIPLLSGLGQCFTVLTLIPWNQEMKVLFIRLSAGILNVLLSLLLIPRLSLDGACYALLFTNLFVSVVSIVITEINGIPVITSMIPRYSRPVRMVNEDRRESGK